VQLGATLRGLFPIGERGRYTRCGGGDDLDRGGVQQNALSRWRGYHTEDPSDRYRFGEPTFAETSANGRDAPKADLLAAEFA
jgi:hypothetical protein